MRSKPLAFPLLVGALVSLVAACGPQTRVVGGGAGPVLRAPVQIAPGSVKADISVVGDATQILKEAIGDSLADAKMTCRGGGAACASIDLHARIGAPAKAFTGSTPPLRVVELVAHFRGSGADMASATVSYQRTVAASGNLSTATWLRISDALTNDLASDFNFRSTKSGIVVRLPSWATMNVGLPRVSQPKSFHVATTGDSRSDDYAIGNVGGKEVRLARRATDYITELLSDELRGAGNIIVPARDGRLVGSELEKFWITSQKNMGGWQTSAEIQLALEVAPPQGMKRKKAEKHRCVAMEKTGGMPGEPDLARLLQKCLGDLVQSIRNDPVWAMAPAAPAS